MSRAMIPRPSPAAGREQERGLIMVLTGLLLTVLMIFAALVIDMGQAYSSRRQMQNASDDAALAGANQLYRVKFPSSSPGPASSTVWETVKDVAGRNGATAVSCSWVDSAGTPQGSCDPAVNPDPTLTDISGVLVTTTLTRATVFSGIVGRRSQPVSTSAAATIQPLAGTGAPFIICGVKTHGSGWDLLNRDHTAVDPAKAQAVGSIPIQASQIPTCGAGAAFKGKSDPSDLFTSPGYYEGNNGNGNDAAIRDLVVGATPCPPDSYDGCDIVIPIADSGTGNGQFIRMHIVALSIWHVTGNGRGNPKYSGTFVANKGLVSSGQGGTGTVTDASTPAVVKLLQ